MKQWLQTLTLFCALFFSISAKTNAQSDHDPKMKELLKIKSISIINIDTVSGQAKLSFEANAVENFSGNLKVRFIRLGSTETICEMAYTLNGLKTTPVKQEIIAMLPAHAGLMINFDLTVPSAPEGYLGRYHHYIKIVKSNEVFSVLDPLNNQTSLKPMELGKDIKISVGTVNKINSEGKQTANSVQSQNYSVNINGKILIGDINGRGLYGNGVALYFRNSSNPTDWYHPILGNTQHVHYDKLDDQGNFNFSFTFTGDLSSYNQVIVIVNTANDATFFDVPTDGYFMQEHTFYNESEGIIASINGNNSTISINQNGIINKNHGSIFRFMQVARELSIQRYGGNCPFSISAIHCGVKDLDQLAGHFVIEYDLPSFKWIHYIEIDPVYAYDETTIMHEYGHYVNFCMWGRTKMTDASKDLKEGWAIFYSFAGKNYLNKVYGDAVDTWDDNTEYAPFKSGTRYTNIRYAFHGEPMKAAIGCYLWSLYDGYSGGNFELSAYDIGDNDDVSGYSNTVFETMRNLSTTNFASFHSAFKSNVSSSIQTSVDDMYSFMFDDLTSIPSHKMRSPQLKSVSLSNISATQARISWMPQEFLGFFGSEKNSPSGYKIYKNVGGAWQQVATSPYGGNYVDIPQANVSGQYKFSSYNSTGDSHGSLENEVVTLNISNATNVESVNSGSILLNNSIVGSSWNGAFFKLTNVNIEAVPVTDWFFLNWNDGISSPARSVLLDQSKSFTANYKGRLRTGNPSNYAKNQNRLAIQTTDGQPSILVYDSMNEIWLNRQDEYELSWANELRLSGNTATASNPSISNEIQVTSSDYRRWAITWVENGLIHLQLVKSNRYGGGDFTYGWSAGATSLIQDDYNHIILENNSIDKYGVPLSTARPVVNLSYYPNDTAPTALILTVVYEGKTSASATATTLIQNELVFPVGLEGTSGNSWSMVSPFYTCTTWSGNRYRALTTENVSGMPVVIRYNARGTNPAKHAVYYLASTGTGTTFTKLMEYNLSTGVNTSLTGLSYVRNFSSLSGNCNYTSGGIVLAAEASIYDYYNPSNPYYDKPTVAVYVKSVSSATTPALSKTYTNYRNGVVMVDQGAVTSTPVYEVNMLPVSGSQWAKATGGTSVTYIQGSYIVQPFVSGRVPAGTRKSVVIQSGSPAKFLNYGGSGVLQKGEGSAADVRAHRTVELSTGEQKEVILDFTGTRVEPVDSLEGGSVICAVEFLTESATSILVSQPDSLIFPLGVNIIRKGVSIRSFKSGLWAALSSQSFEDLQRGDILVFRSDVPVTMLINYEEFNLDGAEGAGKGNNEGVSGTQLSSIKTGVAVYPNPFNPATSIAVSLESPEVVRVTVFNILGQLVTDFGKSELGAGVHSFPFDGRLLASGTYFYRVEIGEKVKTGKLQLLK